MEPTTFEPIALSRARSRSPPRSRSHSRSIRERLSRRNSLSRIYSAQAFDDHAVYSRHNSEASSPVEQTEKNPLDDASTTSSSSPNDADLEKQGTEQLDEPEMEYDGGVIAERDFSDETNLEKQKTKEEQAKDPNLVTWDGPDDPNNPKNWSMRRKWAATFIVSSFTFISPVSSSMVAPALQAMNKDLHVSNTVESQMILSIFVLAYAVGPLFLGPLSEVYGRAIVIQLSNLFYLVWNLACGFAQTSPQMLVFRFFAGIGGSALLAIGGGVLGDCWSADQRGKAISIYALAPLLGPAVGPIAGGFIAQHTTWRWVFWSTTLLTVAIQISGILWLQETYAPTLLGRKAKRLRKETGNMALHTEYDDPNRKITKVLGTALSRPFVLLGTQPIIQVIAIYMAYLYGLFYLLLSTFPRLWTVRYGESVGIGGLNYISLGIGFFLGTQITAPLNDRIYRRLKKRNNGIGKPEFRVPCMFIGSAFVPIGLFIYGWSAQAKTHWIVPNIGAAFCGFGNIICFQCMQTYIVDSYTRYAASGTAAAVVLRSLAGFGFPLFAPAMYNKLGYGWGNSLLGFLAIGFGIPAPFLFWIYGEKLRKRSTYAAG